MNKRTTAMKTLKDNQGAVLVEFVIVLPLLLILLFASIEFGVLFYNQAMITNASREGARTGIVFRPDPRVDPAQIQQVVTNYCSDHVITFGTPNDCEVELPGTLPTASGESLPVRVTYNYGFLLLPNLDFFGVMGIPTTIVLDAETVMRLE